MTGQRAVVRLRWMRGMVTSHVMPISDATELHDELLHDVIECGEGTAFVTMTGGDGRTASIRGREVISVECVPDIADRAHEPRVGEDQPARAVPSSYGTAGTTAPARIVVNGGRESVGRVRVQPVPAATGTDYLRRHAAADQGHRR